MDDEFLIKVLSRIEAANKRHATTIPQEIEAINYIHRLLQPNRMTPPSGGWAANYSTIAAMLDFLTGRSDPLIYDFGGGVSTLYFALYIQKFGGQLISIDHDESFSQKTKEYLSAFELTGDIQQIHAPIIEVDGNLWYDRDAIPRIPGVDLLFIDGPTGSLQPRVRRHALDYMAPLLKSDSLVAIDDTDRQDERELAELWRNRNPSKLYHIQGNLSTLIQGSPERTI